MKLVRCIRGEVWDVAVDVRAGSKTFLQWHAERLSTDNGRALLILEGFAHGFQILSIDAEILYCHSTVYTSEVEAGLIAKNRMLAIAWPEQITELSPGDSQHPILDIQFAGVEL
jgi:dTDP-4-dehydrorhamnose 3,5-epimerase